MAIFDAMSSNLAHGAPLKVQKVAKTVAKIIMDPI